MCPLKRAQSPNALDRTIRVLTITRHRWTHSKHCFTLPETKRTYKLISPTLISELNHDPKREYPADGGFADIYVPSAEIVVECKRRGRADPEGIGGNQDETQLEQLTRYVSAINDSLFDRPNRGMITDGVDYYLYKFGQENNRHKSLQPQLVEHKSFRNHLQLKKALTDIFDPNDRKCKPWVSDDLYEQFGSFLDPIRSTYIARKNEKEVKTRFELWRQLLAASGMDIGDEYDQNELFLQHTLLIAVARAATATMDSQFGEKAVDEYLREGFVSWLLPYRNNAKHLIANVAIEIFTEVARFEWHRERKDVFRPFYERLIDKSRRHMYGEYYTPNWLAEWLVTKMLSKSWIEKSVDRAADTKDELSRCGVLDPCCGSGTFLYEATRLLISSDYVSDVVGGDPLEAQKLVARLIHGFDIHPIAVEIAQASLKRLLPNIPTYRFNIAQTDSLMLAREEQNLYQRSGIVTFTPSVAADLQIRLPERFIQSNSFDQRLNTLITSARENREFPRALNRDLTKKEQTVLLDTYADLIRLCQRFGDGIWVWWIKNAVSSHKLRLQKVNRILTNPPWVTINSISDKNRQDEVIDLAKKHDVWFGGRNATSFDLAAVIVLQTRSIFLSSKGKSAWILNESSARGEQWAKFRSVYAENRSSVYRLGKLKNPPFSGAASCVWIDDNLEQDLTWYCHNNKDNKVDNNLSWSTNRNRIYSRISPKLPFESPSTYRDTPRQGATITPACLTLIDAASMEPRGSTTTGITISSRHQPWKKFGTLKVKVPNTWIRPTLQPDDYFPYGVKKTKTYAIVPMNESGKILPGRNGKNHPQWIELDALYSENCGVGSATPQDLFSQIDFNGKLSSQVTSRSRYRVIYNTSGAWMRALVLTRSARVIDASSYRLDFGNKNEAYYICAILNSQCLQGAYKLCRKSDRHFHKHVWNRIPIPKFDKTKHMKIAQSAMDLERDVKLFIRSLERSNLDKPSKLNELIRELLVQNGYAKTIDREIRRMLPSFCDIPID